MTDEASDKFRGRDSFLHIGTIFMPVVMEGDIFPIIFINAGRSGYRPAKISANIFNGLFGFTFLRLGINIKAMLVIFVTECFCLFKGRTDFSLQFVKECSAECVA